MSGIDDDNAIRLCRADRTAAKQWLDGFSQIERVEEDLAVNHLRRKSKPQLHSIPICNPASAPEYQRPAACVQAVGRLRNKQAVWLREIIRLAPASEWNPGLVRFDRWNRRFLWRRSRCRRGHRMRSRRHGTRRGDRSFWLCLPIERTTIQ